MLDAQSCVSSQRETSRDFSEIAILYRTHHEAELLEKCLQRESIPYVVAGREDFLRHDKVRGLTCFFQFLSEPDDLTALAVCLKLLFSCPEDLSESLQRFLSSYQGYSLPKKLELLENEYRNVGVLTVSLPLFRKAYIPLLERKSPRSFWKQPRWSFLWSRNRLYKNFLTPLLFIPKPLSFWPSSFWVRKVI